MYVSICSFSTETTTEMCIQCCAHQLCFEWAVFPNIYTQFLFYYHLIARHTQTAPNIWQIHDSEPNAAHTQIPNQFICNMFNVNRLCAVANPLYWAKNSIKYVCLCVKFIILNPSTAQMVADSTNKSSLVSHSPQFFFVSHFDFSGNIAGVLGIDFIRNQNIQRSSFVTIPTINLISEK